MRISVVALTIAFCCGYAHAESMFLDKEGKWQSISSDRGNAREAEIAKVKQLVTEGKSDKASKAYKKLRADFPELEGQGLDLFTEAELLFARRDFTKAAEKYTKFLDEHPGSDLCDGAMDRLFQIGTAFLNGQKKPFLWVFRVSAYEDGEKIMNNIADRAGDAPIAKQALRSIARSYEMRHLYRDAHRAWSDVRSRWPAGETGRDALYGMAVNMHAAYRGPGYEAGSLLSARGYYEELRRRYPDFAVSAGVDKTLARISEQAAEKELTVARYYHKMDIEEGKRLHIQEIMDKWSDTAAADKVRRGILDSKP